MIQFVSEFHAVALLLLVGIGCYCGGTFLANPFVHADAVTFYRAVHKNRTRYWRMNLLHTVAVLTLSGGFGLLSRQTWQANPSLTLLGLVLLIAATLLWLAQLRLRLTATTSIANQVFTGLKPPTQFPHNIGAGFDHLFLAFQVCLLVGIAALLASLGDAQVLSPFTTRAGIVVLIASGVYATRDYRWLGGVERALFYPMTTVIVPLGMWFLLNNQ